LRSGEIVRLRAGDIDSAQTIIRIVQSKRRKDRHVMLPPQVLSLSRQWWKVRPTRYDAEMPAQERWLFPGRRRGRSRPLSGFARAPSRMGDGEATRKELEEVRG
jgi:integrase